MRNLKTVRNGPPEDAHLTEKEKRRFCGGGEGNYEMCQMSNKSRKCSAFLKGRAPCASQRRGARQAGAQGEARLPRALAGERQSQ